MLKKRVCVLSKPKPSDIAQGIEIVSFYYYYWEVICSHLFV